MKSNIAEINCNQIKENIKDIRKKLEPKTKLMSVIKANAYGHGAIRVGKIAEESGVDYLAVATLNEAIELRLNNINLPILTLTKDIDLDATKRVGLKINGINFSSFNKILGRHVGPVSKIKECFCFTHNSIFSKSP